MPPHSIFPGVPDISLTQLCQLPYKDQAVWFMNGFWDDLKDEDAKSESIWEFFHHFVKLDMHQTPPKGEDGNELNQVMAAKFLEENCQTLTALARKDAMQEIDVDNNGKMALIEYLTFHFSKDVQHVVDAPQGKASELELANSVITEVLEMLPKIEAKIASQKQALEEQLVALVRTRAAKAAASEAYEKQLQSEADLEQALLMLEASKLELEKAVQLLREQEEAVAKKKIELEAKSKDMTLGAVARGMAANQLQSLLNEDPLPLRKAKITAEAALRRVEREQRHATTKALEAKEQTRLAKEKKIELEEKEKELELKKEQLALAIQELEAAYEEMNKKMENAKNVIEELKKSPGAMGAVWWLERSLFEVDSFMPQDRMRYDHRKPFQFVPPVEGEEPETVAKYTKPTLAPKPKTKLVFSHSRGATKISLDDEETAPKPTLTPLAIQAEPPVRRGSVIAIEKAVTPTPAPVVEDKTEPTPTPVAPQAQEPETPAVKPDAVVFTYFPVRGRGEALKFALTEMALNFETNTVTSEGFMAVKPKLAFGSLPLLEMDGLNLVQGSSTLRYLSRKAGNYPTSLEAQWQFDSLLDSCEDFRIARFNNKPDTDEGKATFEGLFTRHMDQFQSLLGDNDYFVENKFTFADLSVFDLLEAVQNRMGDEAVFKYPTLVQFRNKIASRPKLAAYLKSVTRNAADNA